MHDKKVQGLFGSLKIQQAFLSAYPEFSSSGAPQSDVQRKAAHAIMRCKSGKLGCNRSLCPNCGHMEVHNNSCRNRSSGWTGVGPRSLTRLTSMWSLPSPMS